MILNYYTHNKDDKDNGCHNVIGYDNGPFYTIHLKSKQKDKKSVEFKPAFENYTKGMNKANMIDRFLLGKFNDFLFNKRKDKETK
jgi:hypothetical protein|tara:strand:- start:1994 stop:2248 length:255 start_codon:yes stop_codon:yes gene_type:complete